MSGGSYEHAYCVVQRFAEALERGETFEGRPADGASSLARAGFAAHLRKIAAAMQAIEWEDSFDSSPPLADEAIQMALSDQARKEQLEQALFDLVNMERIVTPDMSGKPRRYAYMRNGDVLAECLDRARALLPYDMQPTDPRHGGKVSP